MKLIKTLAVFACIMSLSTGLALAGSDAKEKTCCQKAVEKGKDCEHPCCVEAHKAGKSCEKCNPNKEDVKKEEKK